MSEESKTTDSDYVHMGDGRGIAVGGGANLPSPSGLDDPGLSQEDRDLRLAIALQQQENAAAYDAHKKKHDNAIAANTNRTSRSNVHSRLAQVRAKDHGMLSVPNEDTTENAYKKSDSDYVSPAGGVNMESLKGALPQEVADRKLAIDLQKVEQTGAGTARTMEKIIKEEKSDDAAAALRNARSGKAAFNK